MNYFDFGHTFFVVSFVKSGAEHSIVFFLKPLVPFVAPILHVINGWWHLCYGGLSDTATARTGSVFITGCDFTSLISMLAFNVVQ